MRKSEADGFPFNRTGAIYKVKALGTGAGAQNYTNTQTSGSENSSRPWADITLHSCAGALAELWCGVGGYPPRCQIAD